MTAQEKDIVTKWQQNAPVDITALADNLGLTVYDDYDLQTGISGKIERDSTGESSSGYRISVNADEPYRRRRFTIAHECAHYLLHRSKIGDGISDDAMYRSEKMNTREEFEANNLAAELLMPRALVARYMRLGTTNVIDLADEFEVSQPAMRVRMRYLYQGKYE